MNFIRPVVFLLFSLCASAQDLRQWKLSLAAVAVSSAMDAHSSIGLIEMNPIMGANRPFRLNDQGRNKLIGVSVLVAVEWVVVKKYPSTARVFKFVNFGYTGTTTAVALRNYQLH